MTTTNQLSSCPVCDHAPLTVIGRVFTCERCGFKAKQDAFLGLKLRDRYVVTEIGSEYGLAARGLVGNGFTRRQLAGFIESVYTDDALTAIAAGDFDRMVMPRSLLSKVLLEQMKETCFAQLPYFQRAHGPALPPGGYRIPQGAIPMAQLDVKDTGTLFLTDKRIIFPSNTFTFLRLDGKLIGLKTFDDGVAVQRRDEPFATYFFGCGANRAALIAAYIQGRVPSLRESPVTEA